MDIRHREAFAQLKQLGVKETQTFHSPSMSGLMLAIISHIAKAPNRYEGLDLTIRFSRSDLESAVSAGGVQPPNPQNVDLASMLSHLVVEETDDDEVDPWTLNPNNPDSPIHDPLLMRYNQCRITANRDRATPAELAKLKTHVESTYLNSPWWDGIHHW